MTRHTMTVDPDGTERLDGAPTGRRHDTADESGLTRVVTFDTHITGDDLTMLVRSIGDMWDTLVGAPPLASFACTDIVTWEEYRSRP